MGFVKDLASIRNILVGENFLQLHMDIAHKYRSMALHKYSKSAEDHHLTQPQGPLSMLSDKVHSVPDLTLCEIPHVVAAV